MIARLRHRRFVGAWVLASLLTASEAFAAPPAFEPVRIETDFGDESPVWVERVAPALEARLREVLEERHGLELSETAATTLEVHVRSLDDNPGGGEPAAVRDYGARVHVRVDGETRGDKVVRCARKTEAELIECALEGLPAALAFVPTRPVPEPTPPPAPAPAATDPTAAPATDRVAQPVSSVRPIGPVGITGIVLGAAGLATTIAGGAVFGRGVEQIESASGRNAYVDHQPLGRALLGSGFAALGLGAILVTVDTAVRANRVNHARRHAELRPTVHLGLAPGFAGAAVRGRF